MKNWTLTISKNLLCKQNIPQKSNQNTSQCQTSHKIKLLSYLPTLLSTTIHLKIIGKTKNCRGSQQIIAQTPEKIRRIAKVESRTWITSILHTHSWPIWPNTQKIAIYNLKINYIAQKVSFIWFFTKYQQSKHFIRMQKRWRCNLVFISTWIFFHYQFQRHLSQNWARMENRNQTNQWLSSQT